MKKKKIDIIYEDKNLIVVNKPAGVLSIGTYNNREDNLYYEVSSYVKRQHKSNKIFIIHRLDKDTSGLIMFAKNIKVKKIMQDNWNTVVRKYIGIVDGITEEKGIIKSYLKMTKTNYVYSTKNSGKLAITEYERIKNNKLYSVLLLNIKTGRHHQIRVHLSDINHPLIGDKIYAKKKDRGHNKLYLHAYYLEFKHPITNEKIILQATIPSYFYQLIDFNL